VTAIVDAELRRPRDDVSRGAAGPAHSSQDDGEADAEAEAHAGMRGGPVSPVIAVCVGMHAVALWSHTTSLPALSCFRPAGTSDI
jgi:hypothetical protein